MRSFGCDLSLDVVERGAFGKEVVAHFRAEFDDCVACLGEQTDLKVEVVPHVVEPPVVQDGRLRSGAGSFDLVRVGGDRIVAAVCITIGGRPVISPYTGEMPGNRGSADPT
jgi:hypothetical protein